MAEHIEAFTTDYLDECAHVLMSTFNTEPWNDSYTPDTAREQLAWHLLQVPVCEGLVSVSGRIVAFAARYREPTDVGDVFNPMSVFCVRPDARRRGV